jgi:hypothetical protein
MTKKPLPKKPKLSSTRKLAILWNAHRRARVKAELERLSEGDEKTAELQSELGWLEHEREELES